MIFRTLLLVYVMIICCSGCISSIANPQFLIHANLLQSKGHHVAALHLYQQAMIKYPHDAEIKKKYYLLRQLVLSSLMNSVKKKVIDRDYLSAEDVIHHAMGVFPDWTAGQRLLEVVNAYRQDDESLDNAAFLLEDRQYLQAIRLVAQVLRHQPGHKEANQLKQQLDIAWQDDVQNGVLLDPRLSELVTVEYLDAPLRVIFDTFSQITHISFFFDNAVNLDQFASMQAYDIPARDAFLVFLKTHQLEYQILNTNSLLIYPSTAEKLREYQELSVRVFQIIHVDPIQLSDTLKTVLKVRDLSVDKRNGLIVIRDTPSVIRSVEKIINTYDRPEAEVDLEMDIVEINRNRMLSLGISWPDKFSVSPNIIADSTARTLLSNLIKAASSRTSDPTKKINMTARSDSKDTKILANPRIRVRNKEQAQIQIGDRYPLVSSITSPGGVTTDSVSFIDVGLRLDVEPTISLENTVSIKVNLEVSSLSNRSSTRTGYPVYQIGKRSVNTVLRLQDGETQVIAGLVKSDVRNVKIGAPFLTKIPFIRRFFGYGEDESNKTEIILSITPHIVYNRQRLMDIEAEFYAGTDYQVATESIVIPSDEA